jgi:endonuclease/exonuclease/phosphatase (EEP) superfamily protein YafD
MSPTSSILPALLTLAALIHPLALVFGRLDWRIDLLTHFSEPALAVTLVALGVVAWRRWRWLAMGLAGLAALQGFAVLRNEWGHPVEPDPRSPAWLRILMANVFKDNDRYDDLARLIRRERPDVVGLVEYAPGWPEGLADIRREFPYRVEAPTGSKGLALWFRARPLAIDLPESPMPGAWPFLHASFEFEGRTRHLWLIHPSLPFARRNTPELAALAERIGRTGGSRIVVGDMNCTEGSPHFADFLRDAGLRDSRLGFGRQPSWPTDWPYRIALDHAFVSDDLAVLDRRLGPMIGSDHFPLVLDLAPASGASAATSSER